VARALGDHCKDEKPEFAIVKETAAAAAVAAMMMPTVMVMTIRKVAVTPAFVSVFH